VNRIELLPVEGIPAVRPGDDLAALVLAGLRASGLQLLEGDILVVCQKAVSRSEGRVVSYESVSPSPFALTVAAHTGKDARIVELILQQTRRIVKMDRGHLIAETRSGWVCANAGVDESNSGNPGRVVLLPDDPDASARRLRDALQRAAGCSIAVIVSDTFGRPWREGLVDVAIGAAGIEALLDCRGQRDLDGRELRHTVLAQADALAAAAGLLMRKDAGIPCVLVRGYAYRRSDAGAAELMRSPAEDLFR